MEDKFIEAESTVPKPPLRNKIVIIVAAGILAICILIAIFNINGPKKSVHVDNSTQSTKLSALEKEVSLNPTSDKIIQLTAMYINNNMPNKAFPYLKALIKKEPNNAYAYNNLGVANMMLKNYMQAIEACTKAAKLDSSFQLAKNNVQWAIGERNTVLKNIDSLAKINTAKKDNAYYMQLGLYYLQVGNYNNSILTWQTGLQQYPGSKTAYYNNIGSALVLKKQYQEAMTYFNKVLAIEPGNQLAKNNIDWAKSEANEQ